MIPEIGLYALILALICAGLQLWYGLFSVREPAMTRVHRLVTAQAGLTLFSFGCLIVLFAISDFSVLNVVQNSHTQKPFLYKLTASWASHEGSMLLWCLILALFGAGIARLKDLPDILKQKALGVQGALAVGFLSFLIFTSNPFARVAIPPFDGQDLNPILQDPSLAIHPPMLFLGYVGFSAQFCLAIAVLLRPDLKGREWIRAARIMTLIAWGALTAGLCLGSFWAYYELGWGGWWFWDPVENAALMPWLTGTALLHSLRVLHVRTTMWKWTVLLSILTFGLSVLGTFLVRSGLLTSVHSFAVDPERGLYILALAGIFIGGAFLLYGLRSRYLEGPVVFHPSSREAIIVLNNFILLIATITVFLGTAYPIILPALTGDEISVGAPYFNAVILPLALPMLVLMGGGIFLNWRRTNKENIKHILQKNGWAAMLGIVAGIAVLLGYDDAPVSAAVWVGLGVWLMAGAVRYGLQFGDIRKLTRSQRSMTIAHFGVGLSIIGMVGSGLLALEREGLLSPGQDMQIGPYTLKMEDVGPKIGPNYFATQGRFEITDTKTGDTVTTLVSERRRYPVAGTQTTETAIRTGLKDAIYIALGSRQNDLGDNGGPAWIVRAQYHPLIAFLWIGMGLVVFSLLGHIRLPKTNFGYSSDERVKHG